MKSVLAGLLAAASLLAVSTPSTAAPSDAGMFKLTAAHRHHVRHKVCHFNRHHHRVCHWR